MEFIQRTLEKIVISVTSKEIEKNGFDFIWDKVRSAYSVNKFDILSISADKKNNNIYFIELKPKK
jgi:hypothetical protein